MRISHLIASSFFVLSGFHAHAQSEKTVYLTTLRSSQPAMALTPSATPLSNDIPSANNNPVQLYTISKSSKPANLKQEAVKVQEKQNEEVNQDQATRHREPARLTPMATEAPK